MADEIKDTEVVAQSTTDKAEAKAKKPAKKAKKAKSHKVATYLKDLKSELNKITWYSRKDTINSTILVCVVMVLFAAVIALVDYLFGSGIGLLGGIFN